MCDDRKRSKAGGGGTASGPPSGGGPTVTITIHTRAILLDMDGTLVDSLAVVERVWRDWAVAHALDPAAVLAVIHGRQCYDSMRDLLPHRTHEETLADSRSLAEEETSDVEGVRAIEGARPLLDALIGLPHAMVTSATAPLARARMAAAGLAMPGVAVTAEAVSASKPDPEGFLAAAAALQVPAEDCVVFEDSGAGIAAARAAGMRVLGVGASAAHHRPHWNVPDLRAVRVHEGVEGLTMTLPQSALCDWRD